MKTCKDCYHYDVCGKKPPEDTPFSAEQYCPDNFKDKELTRRVTMKFNVEKFISDTNNSHYYHKWNDNLKQMNDMLGLPHYENSKHYWTFFLAKNMRMPFHIGFDDNGNIFCEYSSGIYKDENKKIMTGSQANAMAETFLKVLNVFDEFGFIIHPTEKGGAE